MSVLCEEIEGDIGSVPRCQSCGSKRVVKDAWACWNPAFGIWELEKVHDQTYCQQCEAAATLVWSKPEVPQNGRIRELNDAFRRDGQGNGSVMLTVGIQGEGQEFLEASVAAVQAFEAFSEDNDPWGEHDFGAVEVSGEKVFWKIDYYDPDLQAGSENPANDAVTHRVLTIMLASEY
ncbi:DUF3768 domain-containing protein [Gymnodinialimonas sp.]